MVRPPALCRGDRLAIVAPASPFAREEFDAGVAELRALGFEPVFDDRVFARSGFVAGPPELRAAALNEAWRDPSIAGIVAVRGGYGSVQVLPLLDLDAVRAAPKPFVGYSDLTALLSVLVLRVGQVAFHGPMLAGRLARGAQGYDRECFLRMLTVPEPYGALRGHGLRVVRGGEATGVLVGGTLTQLLASFRTPFEFDPPEGVVLLLDEINERPFRLDRMLTQLGQSGILGRTVALVFNELCGCDEPGGEPTARAVLEALASLYHGPILAGLPCGHAAAAALTLPLGCRVRVVAEAPDPALVFEEAAVAPRRGATSGSIG
jgi:muramoyltetrapeptide carboxypeptidase